MLSLNQLESEIRQGIPLAAQMAFRISELSPNAIRVIGGGTENINVHGTAFAGSLYAVATLALWGLIRARLPERSTLVLAEGKIRYRKPVHGDIVASCKIDATEMDRFLQRLQNRRSARLNARVELSGDQENAAEYQGTMFAQLGQTTSQTI
jgi:thioesterase domain-containing protein